MNLKLYLVRDARQKRSFSDSKYIKFQKMKTKLIESRSVVARIRGGRLTGRKWKKLFWGEGIMINLHIDTGYMGL